MRHSTTIQSKCNLSESSFERPIPYRMGLIGHARSLWRSVLRTQKRSRANASEGAMRLQFANGAYSLTAKEIERLIFAANNPRDRVLLLVLCETGIRRFEASAIAWENIDIVRRLLTVRNGKGGKRRVIPITERLSRELQLLADGARHEAVFHSRQAGSLSVRQVNRIVSTIGAHAGVRHPNPRYRNVTCHLLRHTFARL